MLCVTFIVSIGFYSNVKAEENIGYYEYNADTGEETYFMLNSVGARASAICENEIVEYDSNGAIVSRTTLPQDGTEASKTAVNSSPIQQMSLSSLPSDYNKILDRSERLHKAVGYIHVKLGTDDYGQEKWTFGTGFLEGENLLVTAGHLCYDSVDDGIDWGWTEDLRFYPGAYTDDYGNQIYPYGEIQRQSITVASKWKNNGNEKYDWGVVTLKTAIGEETGILGKKWQSSSYKGTEVVMTGYPRVFGLTDQIFYMYESSGSVRSNTTYILSCDYNSYYRASGSPICIKDTAIVIGIQSRTDAQYSYAVRITEDLYDLLQEKLDEYRNSQ